MSIKRIIPESIFGDVEEDFFAGVGAIVMLTSLLEDHLLVLYQALTKSGQTDHTRIRTGDLIDRTAELVLDTSWPSGYGDDATNRDTLQSFLNDTRQFFRSSQTNADAQRGYELAPPVRNDYAHNLWVLKSDGRMFGHRADRNGTPSSPRIQVIADVPTVRSQVQKLVQLDMRWSDVRRLVLARDHTLTGRE